MYVCMFSFIIVIRRKSEVHKSHELAAGLSFVYGVLWYLLAGSHARRVQTIKLSEWRL